jgi:outer membrane lipoprotein carrier protein
MCRRRARSGSVRWLIAIWAWLVACPLHASGLAQLNAFLDGAKSGRATFRQAVLAKGAREPQQSSGTFVFQRPGRFRWSYDRPFEQLIVGDGSRLWIYDRDLKQVIVRKLDAALGASPAALLAGDNSLERNFELADAGRQGDLEFVVAKPRTADSGMLGVRIGFKDGLPRVMELADAFGNVTTLTFAMLERNPKIDPAQFAFVPPPGADVVGDEDKR